MQIQSQEASLVKRNYSLEVAELPISGYNCEHSEIETNAESTASSVEDKGKLPL
jgi:hypothetical protein